MKKYFCWRCNCEMPFLEENEWVQIFPLLNNALQEIKNYRSKYSCDLSTARQNIKVDATLMFEKLTSFKIVNYDVIFHHRLADWGPECKECGYLLRTKEASFCANCGQT